MKTKLVLLASYFAIMPGLIFSLIVFTLFVHFTHFPNSIVFKLPNTAFRAVPTKNIPFEGGVKPQEARVEALKQFLGKYGSPLYGHAEAIVAAADTYGIDYRLLPAIAMQESTLCKNIPKDSYNCWGWGIYGGKVTKFTGYADAIETISRVISLEYKNKGYGTPSEIVSKYTPSNTNNWSGNVTYVMDRIASSF